MKTFQEYLEEANKECSIDNSDDWKAAQLQQDWIAHTNGASCGCVEAILKENPTADVVNHRLSYPCSGMKYRVELKWLEIVKMQRRVAFALATERFREQRKNNLIK
jgi:hypothetical protein